MNATRAMAHPPEPQDNSELVVEHGGEHEHDFDFDSSEYTYSVTDDNFHTFFRNVHGRALNTVQPFYMLPCDREEIRRQDHFHKLMYLIMADKNYVGPVPQVLSTPSRRKKQVLDIGTGGGLWAIQMADEFPNAEVTGADLAPTQPELVPPNCDFEIFDAQRIPFPDEFFDLVHARAVHMGMRNYPQFLLEVARVLRPGGVVILAETELKAYSEKKVPIEPGARGGAPGWHAFWEQMRRCLNGHGVDTSVPVKLPRLLTETGAFDDVVGQEAVVPVGFWPKDPGLLAVGQFAWMHMDLFLPAARPIFMSYGLSEFRVNVLLEDAQKDLYHPFTRPYSCIHVTHARKRADWRPDPRMSIPWPMTT